MSEMHEMYNGSLPSPVRAITDADLLSAVDKVLAARRGAIAPPPWSQADITRLAASGVAKVDLLGERGATLCSMDEIVAMAAALVMSGILPPPHKRVLPQAYRQGDDR